MHEPPWEDDACSNPVLNIFIKGSDKPTSQVRAPGLRAVVDGSWRSHGMHAYEGLGV